MGDLNWKEAIIKVLAASHEPMHYTDIADEVVSQKLRSEVGATPANSVGAILAVSLQDEGQKSPFIRVTKGVYALREPSNLTPLPKPAAAPHPTPDEDDTGFINAFGMYWARDKVLWKTTPQVFGRQQPGANAVDFCAQTGVYLLHDGRSVVYVGRTTDQPLGVRLRQHTTDRLNGRWNRFSWFGILGVKDNGTLASAPANFTIDNLIATMEALLIEGLEPPQNRKRGDDFRAVEFLQAEDPQIEKTRILDLMEELKKKI